MAVLWYTSIMQIEVMCIASTIMLHHDYAIMSHHACQGCHCVCFNLLTGSKANLVRYPEPCGKYHIVSVCVRFVWSYAMINAEFVDAGDS